MDDSPIPASGRTARADRLAAKLRENLRRRKTQARALGTTDAAGETPAPTDRTEGTLPKPPLSR